MKANNKFIKYQSLDEKTYQYWATYYRYIMVNYFEEYPYTNEIKIEKNETGYDYISYGLDHTVTNIERVIKTHYKQSKDNLKWYVEYPKKEVEAFKKLLKMINKNHCYRMFTKEYGVINQQYEKRIKQMYSTSAYIFTTAVDACIERIYDESKYLYQPFQTLVSLGASEDKFLEMIWFYALDPREMATEYQAGEDLNYFNVLVDMYYKLSKETSIEIFVAQVTSLIKRGGVKAAHNFVKEMLNQKAKTNWDYENLTYYGFKVYPACLEYLASALSTLGATETEKMVLQYMVENNHTMSNAAYERFNYLTNHNDKAPVTYQVSKGSNMNIEVGSLNWREDDYNAFFDELKLQKRKLEYCLALRDENINITLNKAKIPSLEDICERLRSDLDDEFGEDVFVRLKKNTLIISDGLNEKIDGIVVGFDIKECEHLELFVYLMKIGKKLNIKFYSLFNPGKKDVDNQRQQALFLYKNLSPTVGVWENSVKETVQTSLQYILNSSIGSVQIKKNDEDEF